MGVSTRHETTSGMSGCPWQETNQDDHHEDEEGVVTIRTWNTLFPNPFAEALLKQEAKHAKVDVHEFSQSNPKSNETKKTPWRQAKNHMSTHSSHSRPTTSKCQMLNPFKNLKVLHMVGENKN